jgi:hypothetical protein
MDSCREVSRRIEIIFSLYGFLRDQLGAAAQPLRAPSEAHRRARRDPPDSCDLSGLDEE